MPVAVARYQIVVKTPERGQQNADVDSRLTGLANIRDLHAQAVGPGGQLTFCGDGQIFPQYVPHFGGRSEEAPVIPEHNVITLCPIEGGKHFPHVDWHGGQR